jgi:aryl-alcohol dehydrogenase-like predicted oxidoreductase/GNAT superfamily N-acetyltransferase
MGAGVYCFRYHWSLGFGHVSFGQGLMRVQYRTLGKTGLRISVIAFGCGPVSGWMAELGVSEQRAVIQRAIDLGLNWFDTAAGYGDGKSEASLGAALHRLGHPPGIHIATKVRYLAEHLADIRGHTRASVGASLKRLGVDRVDLLQLHNSITARRGEEPTSITPQDILGPRGVLESFRELQVEGVVQHIGLTGIGQPVALRQVVSSGGFATMQVPYNLLNASAGHDMPPDFAEANYGNIISDCAEQEMGVFAIRVFAGGALLGKPPSPYTFKTLFFPLALYERDTERAAALACLLPPGRTMHGAAIRFLLDDLRLASAIVGFRTPAEIEQAAAALADPSLPTHGPVIVQVANEAVVPQISRIALESFLGAVSPHYRAEGLAAFGRYASPEAITERMRAGHIFYLACREESTLGIAEIRPPAHLAMLFVLPGHQRRGVGKALLRQVIRDLQSTAGRVVVTVASSPNAVGAYKRFGFVAEGEMQEVKGIRFQPMQLVVEQTPPRLCRRDPGDSL